MLRTGRWSGLGLALIAPILCALPVVAQTDETGAAPAVPATTAPSPVERQNRKTPPKQMVLPPMPSGPLSQLPMDQIPPSPATVTFQGGMLAISAHNATLGEILGEVRKLTGAAIDIPAGLGANERVVTSLGPGAPRDVLAVLLNGSSFNYVMIGSNSDPTAVASVVLMAKPSAAGENQPPATVAANVYQNSPPVPPHPMPFNRPGGFSPQPQPQVVNPEADSDDGKDDEAEAADDADDQAQPTPGQQPGQPGQPDANAQQATDPNQPNAGPKTPEQILEMLRRQQQGQPGAVPPQQPPQQQ